MARIVHHRRYALGDGATTYRLIVELEPPRKPSEQEPEGFPGFYRTFEWGSAPIVPKDAPAHELEAAQEAYAGIHDRELVRGEPFVTQDEYAALQVYEAMAALAAESKSRSGAKLVGEAKR